MKTILNLFLFFSPIICMSQNVGIGMTNPTRARLEVAGAVGNTVAILGSDSAGVAFMRNNAAIGFNVYYDGTNYRCLAPGHAMMMELDPVAGSLAFRSFVSNSAPNFTVGNPTSRLKLFNNGQVVINGDQRMNATLYVGRPFDRVTAARFYGTTHSSSINENSGNTYINGGKDGSDVLINDVNTGTVYWGGSETRIGINNTSPTAILDIKQVNGLGVIWVVPTNFRNWEFRVFKNKNTIGSDYRLYYNEVHLGSFSFVDGKYYNYSDKRLKEQIQPMAPVMGRLMELTPATYRFGHDPANSSRSIGFSAQEVGARFPELVSGMPGNDMGYPELDTLHMMNYNQLGVLAIQAIKEQQDRIETLRQTNSKLSAQLSALEKQLARLPK